MDPEQLNRICASINRVAAATLTASIIGAETRKPSLKDIQTTFNDCYMIVDPGQGTEEQRKFQERIDKKEW